ncbi:MAG: YihY/virulence factor BrkB family protein [Ginsengibacter sp.]
MNKLERTIYKTAPGYFLINKSKRWSPPGFEGLAFYDVMSFFRSNFSVPNLTERAAAISYNFIMSVPPTCLFLFTLIPNLPFISKRSLKKELHTLIVDIVPAKTYNTGLINFVDSFINGSKIGLISFSFLLSLFFASNAIMGVMRAFNKDYIGFEKIKGLRKRWVALKLTALLFGLLMLCLVLLLLQNNILNWIGVKNKVLKDIILYGKWVLIIALVFYSFAFIYRYAPATTKKWKLLSPGALIATFLSILFTIGFSSFIDNFGRFNLLYGSIGTIMVFMIVVFINSLVVLVGFDFNVSIKTLRALSEQNEQEPNKQVVSVAT